LPTSITFDKTKQVLIFTPTPPPLEDKLPALFCPFLSNFLKKSNKKGKKGTKDELKNNYGCGRL
jgi:hypothetical protein